MYVSLCMHQMHSILKYTSFELYAYTRFWWMQYLSEPAGVCKKDLCNRRLQLPWMMPTGHNGHIMVKLITARNRMCMHDLCVLCTRGDKILAVRVLFWRRNLRHTLYAFPCVRMKGSYTLGLNLSASLLSCVLCVWLTHRQTVVCVSGNEISFDSLCWVSSASVAF